MPFKTIMDLLGFGVQKTAAQQSEEETKRQEEEKKKKRKNVFKPHGRSQMTDKEFKELEEASK